MRSFYFKLPCISRIQIISSTKIGDFFCREHLLIQIIEAATCMEGGSSSCPGVKAPSSGALSLLPIFVSKWIDYSNKYGFGYQLSDNSVGVIFNDQTRICQSPDGSVCEFIEPNPR